MSTYRSIFLINFMYGNCCKWCCSLEQSNVEVEPHEVAITHPESEQFIPQSHEFITGQLQSNSAFIELTSKDKVHQTNLVVDAIYIPPGFTGQLVKKQSDGKVALCKPNGDAYLGKTDGQEWMNYLRDCFDKIDSAMPVDKRVHIWPGTEFYRVKKDITFCIYKLNGACCLNEGSASIQGLNKTSGCTIYTENKNAHHEPSVFVIDDGRGWFLGCMGPGGVRGSHANAYIYPIGLKQGHDIENFVFNKESGTFMPIDQAKKDFVQWIQLPKVQNRDYLYSK